MRKLIALITLVVMTLGLSACAPSFGRDDFQGRWVSDDSGLVLTGYVVGEDFEIHLDLADGTKGMYWRGTFPLPDELDSHFTVLSVADTALLDQSLFGSSLEEKEFVFHKGEIVFDFTMLNETRTISLKREDV